MSEARTRGFSGRAFTANEIALMREVVETCAGLTRRELAHTRRACGGILCGATRAQLRGEA